jgi:heptosyltransferase-2
MGAEDVPAGGFRRIAVLRLSSLGDVVLSLPVVDALARAWPGAELHYWVKEEYADLVRRHPAVHHVRALEQDASRLEDLVSMSAELEPCDLIVDLHANLRTRVLTIRQRARLVRVRTRRLQRARWVHARWSRPAPLPHAIVRYGEALAPLGVSVSTQPRVHVEPALEAWARGEGWGFAGPRPRVALCPGALHASKRWPESSWLELDERLEAAGLARLVLTTGAERRGLPGLAARVAGGGTVAWAAGSIERAAALLGEAAVAVTHDSGLMHLAAARGAKVVALFGSTSPVLGFSPAGEGHVVLSRDLPCQPCTLHGRERCPLGHHACMTGWSAAEVAGRVLARLPGEPGGWTAPPAG